MLGWFILGLAGVVASPQPQNWMVASQFVAPDGQAGARGTLDYEVGVDGSGQVRACRILRSSGVARVDEQACAFLARVSHGAPWRPASADQRQRGTLRWTIELIEPEDDIDFPVRGLPADLSGRAIVLTLDINSVGRAVGCAVTQAAGDAAIDSIVCARAQGTLRFARANEGRGRPEFATVSRTVRLRALPRLAPAPKTSTPSANAPSAQTPPGQTPPSRQ